MIFFEFMYLSQKKPFFSFLFTKKAVFLISVLLKAIRTARSKTAYAVRDANSFSVRERWEKRDSV